MAKSSIKLLFMLAVGAQTRPETCICIARPRLCQWIRIALALEIPVMSLESAISIYTIGNVLVNY